MKIIVDGVSKEFKNNMILDNINVTFEEGHIYGLVGRNGTGKSVFLKMLCGFYRPTSGYIYYDDVDIFEKDMFAPNTRALIEQPYFVGELSGYDNLKLLAKIQNKIEDEDILRTLKDVNLYEDKDKKYHKYSLGMKQKLAVAQVLMEDPKVIILDEPFNAIEEESANKIKEILLNEKKKGKIIIIASHVKEDIDYLADIVYRFDNSKVKKEKQ